jgi:hypothetical protein
VGKERKMSPEGLNKADLKTLENHAEKGLLQSVE